MIENKSGLSLWWASRKNRLKHLWHRWRGNRFQSVMLAFRQEELDRKLQKDREQRRESHDGD